MLSHLKTLLRAALAGVALLFLTVAYAADSSLNKVVNGVAIYLGVIPAEIVVGHPKSHTEAGMHGGMPAGQHQNHVVVALFDNATGKRITAARVKANVSKIGLSGVQKKLDPMLIAGTVSYGNYFNMPVASNPYRIKVRIELPGMAEAIEAQFDYQHVSD